MAEERTCRTCGLKEAWRDFCVSEQDWVDPEGTCCFWTLIPEKKSTTEIELWDEDSQE